MGAPSKYPAPLEQLADLACAARGRGVPFDVFWEWAVRPDGPIFRVTDEDAPAGVVLWPSDPPARRDWRAAILETREGWRRAYEGDRPAPADLAVAQLRVWLAEHAPLTVEPVAA